MHPGTVNVLVNCVTDTLQTLIKSEKFYFKVQIKLDFKNLVFNTFLNTFFPLWFSFINKKQKSA